MTSPVAGLSTTTFDGDNVDGEFLGGAGDVCRFEDVVAERAENLPCPRVDEHDSNDEASSPESRNQDGPDHLAASALMLPCLLY